jgi:hypothetical protein
MNTPPASKPDTSNQIDRLVEQKDSGPSATSAAALELKLEEEQSQRKIERFFWILLSTILGDCVLFKFLDSAGGNLFVGLLSLILLIGCAHWLEVPWVHLQLDRLFNRLVRGDLPRGSPRDGEES